MIADDADNTSAFAEIMHIYEAVTGSRFLNGRSSIPNPRALIDTIMPFSDREFKVIARCDKASFLRLVQMIKDHHVFDRTSKHKQSPVWLQLLVVLNRFGCDGNGASIQQTAMLNVISYGSVKKFTERVITAIRSLEAQYVYWPSTEERSRISKRMDREHGLPGAVGIKKGRGWGGVPPGLCLPN